MSCCFKLAPALPLGKLVASRGLITDFEEKLNILHRAGQIPVWINFIRHLMIIVGGVIVFLLLAEICGFADEIFATTSIKRGYASFGKFEMIGAVKTTFLRLTIGFHLSTVAFGGCR